MSNGKKALKSGIWYTISNFLTKSLIFITTPIFTRLLTKEEFGTFNNFTSWLSILSVLVTLNLVATLISARYEFEKDLHRYIASMIALSICSVSAACIVINIFQSYFTHLFDMDIFYVNMMFIYLLFSPAIDMFQSNQRYFYKYKLSVLIAVSLALGSTGLGIGLVLSMQDKLLGRTLGYIVPTAVVGGAISIYYIIKGKGIKLGYWKYALPICLPFIPHLLSLTILNSMDKTMITKLCGAESTALYSLAYTCGMIVVLLLTSMNTAYGPWLAEQLHYENYEEIYNFSKKYVLCFCALAIGIMLLAPEVLFILGGNGYLEAKYVIPPVAAGCSCQFLYTMFVNVEQIKKKTIGMAIGSATAAILNLILNWLMIPRFGYVAAAYTTLACYIWLLGCHMFLVYRMKLGRIYDYKFIIGIVAVNLFLTVVMNFLYHYDALRLLITAVYVLILLGALYKNRKLILELIKKK